MPKKPRPETSPVAAIACYGPTPVRATKLVASIVAGPTRQVADSRVWSTLIGDVRDDPSVRAQVSAWTAAHGVSETITAPRVIGCPHQEGIDYPQGEHCPRCPVWAVYDRWTGQPCLPRHWSAAIVLAVLSTPGHVARGPAIIEADRYRDAVIDAVVRALERLTRDPEGATDADGSLITDGLFLCARWRTPRVYRPLVTWLSTATSTDLDLIGDVLTQDVGRILAGVWGGDLEPLQQLIETRTADEFARAAGLNALALLVAWKEASRDTVVTYLVRLATDGLERAPGQVWNSLAVESAEMEALEVFPLLRAAYAAELIEEDHIGPTELDEVEAGPRGARLQEMRRRHPLVHDVLRELSWAEPRRYVAPPPQLVGGRKIGRNEPCPCGSGRKYKKCCGG